MPLPPNASITDVINKLTELEGINQKTELASVIGSPALSTDTVAQQIVKLQDSKDLLATNLTAKGQVTANDEPIEDMATKVGDIVTGVKFASGSVFSNGSNSLDFTAVNNTSISLRYVAFAGLTFKPKVIHLSFSNANSLYTATYNSETTIMGETCSTSQFTTASSSELSYNLKVNTGYAYVTAEGFRLPVVQGGVTYTWRAYG